MPRGDAGGGWNDGQVRLAIILGNVSSKHLNQQAKANVILNGQRNLWGKVS